MKSKAFILLAANLLIAATGLACGPFYPNIPRPIYFVLEYNSPLEDYTRTENLLLWQSQTSDKISLGDIEQVVYRDSLDKFREMSSRWDKQSTHNGMYNYLVNKDREAIEFLDLAKAIEETRRDMRRSSPWYYPESRYETESDADLQSYIDRAMSYKGERFKERYALQVCRGLFATNQHERCVEYYDSVFAPVPSTSLMKRMAGNYAAGSWVRLGAPEKGDPLYAQSGDIFSLSVENPIEYMLDVNPNAPEIMQYMRRYVARDSARMAETLPIAKKALANRRLKNKGDWGYFLAYFYNHHANDPKQAAQYLRQALARNFSSDEMKTEATVYMMKLDGSAGNHASLLKNLKWFEEKRDPTNLRLGTLEYNLQNLILEDWIPQLWQAKDYSTAILLAAYVEANTEKEEYYERGPLKAGEIDRGGLTFQLMQSLTSSQLADARKKIMRSSELNDYLRQPALQSSDLFNELIGTLALREGNYQRAKEYLTQVGIDYQRSMHLYQQGYLGADAFKYYQTRLKEYSYDEYKWYCDFAAAPTPKTSPDNAKLEFAKQMLDYQQQMTSAKTADERAWARFMYALGRRNSFEQCWGLTQYWRGMIEWRFIPTRGYWDDGTTEKKYGFLYNYDRFNAQEVEEAFNREVEAVLKQMTTDEGRARIEYALCNYKTIAQKYYATEVAAKLRTSCDNWLNWM